MTPLEWCKGSPGSRAVNISIQPVGVMVRLIELRRVVGVGWGPTEELAVQHALSQSGRNYAASYRERFGDVIAA